MPADFEKCMTTPGHKVRRKRMNKTQYANFCIVNGKSHMGEMHTYQKATKPKK